MAKFTNELTLDVKPFLDALKKAVAAAGGDVSKIESELGSIEADAKIQVDTSGAVEEIKKIEDAAKESASNSAGFFQSAFAGGFLGGIASGAASEVVGIFTNAAAGARDLVNAQGDLAAATGATGKELESLKQAAENAFIGGVGESVAEATRIIGQAQNILGDAFDPAELGDYTAKAQALGNLYDKDINEVLRLTAPLIQQFGLSADEAFNLAADGLKNAGTAQDDYLDSIAEYSQLAKEAGLSAAEFNELLIRGGEEGVFNTDKIADSLKELQIRLNAGDIAKELAEFGNLPGALSSTLDEIVTLGEQGVLSASGVAQRSAAAIETAFDAGEITNATRSQLQVAFAGTPAEDLGADLYGRIFGAEIDTAEIEARAQQAGEAASNAVGQYLSFETILRELSASVQTILADVLTTANQVIAPIISDIGASIKKAFEAIGPTLQGIGVIIGGAIVVALKVFSAVIGTVAEGLQRIKPIIPVIAAGVAAYAIATNAAAIATTAAAAKQAILNAVMAANPIGAVVLAITALVAGYALLADALDETAAEQLEAAEATKENLQTQIDQNKEQQKSVKNTKNLTEEYQRLAEKQNRSKEESDRLFEIQAELDKQYPELIDQTASFAENLDGVKQAGKLATDELNGLNEESDRLAQTFKETTKLIAGLKRNVAIQELEDSFGDFNLLSFDTGQENRFRQALRKQVDLFKSELFKASTSKEVREAQARLFDFLNQEGSRLNDDTQLQDIVSKVTAAATAASDALEVWSGGAKEVADASAAAADQVEQLNNTTAGGGGGGASAFEQALKTYKEIEARTKSILADEVKRVQLSQDLTDEEKKRQSQQLTNEANSALRKAAQDLFKASTDEFGLFLESTIAKAGSSAENQLRDIFRGLANTVGVPLAIDPAETEKNFRRGIEEFTGRLAQRIEIPVDIEEGSSSIVENVLTGIALSAAENINSILGIGKKEADTQYDEQQKALEISLKRREITYQEYQDRLSELEREGTEERTALGQAAAIAFGVIQEQATATATEAYERLKLASASAFTLATEGASLSAEETQALGENTLTTGEKFELLGEAAGATFANMVASGANAGEALLSTLKDTLKLAAQAFLPTIFANFLSFLPPPFNIAAATAAVGLVNGLIDQFLAFEEGGLVPGGEQLIRVNEAGQEFVMNAKATKKYGPMLEAMNAGKDPAMVGSDIINTLDNRLQRVEQAIIGLGQDISRRTRIEGELAFAGGSRGLVGYFDTETTYNKRRKLR